MDTLESMSEMVHNGLANTTYSSIVLLLRYFLQVILGLMIKQYADIQQAEDFKENLASLTLLPIFQPIEEFDFIVVGGGSAGAVVANRLSSPKNGYKVLLLETGGNPNLVSYLPGLDVIAPNHPDIDYMYKTVEIKDYCLSCNYRQAAVTRGKGLGGSSNLNFMIYNRGNPKGFDEWAEIANDTSWRYEHLLKFFKKSERYNGHYPNSLIHGCRGEMFVSKSPYMTGVENFEGALHDHGLPNQDINANQTNAFMSIDQTTANSYRWSSYNAFLKPILERPNLTIYRYSFVTKLIYHPLNKTRVIGVEYYRQNLTHPRYAYVTKEVILSGGAYNSPKLLMLSGIGPRQHLEELQIPVVSDLQVGVGYQDHPTTLFPITFNTSMQSRVFERDVLNSTKTLSDQAALLTNLGGTWISATGYMSTRYNDDVTWPDMEAFISFQGLSLLTAEVLGPLLNINPQLFESYLGSHRGSDGNMILVTLVRPKSVGWVKLASRNPFAPPIINPNFFTDKNKADINSMIEGIKFMVKFYEESETYKKIGAQLLPNPWPGCSYFIFRSDAYWDCFVRHLTFTLWHPTTTCKMGKSEDPDAVVDSRLRVIGVQGLRVIDNSIMPVITNGNTNAPAVMIGEKGSAMIIDDWNGIPTKDNLKPCV